MVYGPPMKPPKHQPPAWLDPLETGIERAVFWYELARRTPKGRKRKLPQWDKVPPQVRLALRRKLSGTRPRVAWTLEPSLGFMPLTYRDKTLHLDLTQPDAVLLRIVKTALRHLRDEHGIHPSKATTDTRGTPWRWLAFLDAYSDESGHLFRFVSDTDPTISDSCRSEATLVREQ